MLCGNCGANIDGAAKFCDQCGADLGAMPRVPAAPMTAAPASPPSPPLAPAPVLPFQYVPTTERAWWYPIGVWVILAAFSVLVDLATSGRITWSPWPVGILGIFLVGFTLLHRLEAWSLRPR